MATAEGFEPSSYCLEGSCSIRLSYAVSYHFNPSGQGFTSSSFRSDGFHHLKQLSITFVSLPNDHLENIKTKGGYLANSLLKAV